LVKEDQKMIVGDVVQLKVDCLLNPKGTIGVVYFNYGDGCQAIFKNGNYDGFSFKSKMPDGSREIDYFLVCIGHTPILETYQFKNVIQLSRDFERGVFDSVFKSKA
jgi:hypothetical protein